MGLLWMCDCYGYLLVISCLVLFVAFILIILILFGICYAFGLCC